MPDMEKVIKGIECCKAACGAGNCPYWNGSMIDGSCMLKLHADALTLLKEQEAAEPVMKKGRWFTVPTCRKCGYFFATGTKPNYCSNCGQAVKWNADN